MRQQAATHGGLSCADGRGVDNMAPAAAATAAVAGPPRCEGSPLVACDDVAVVQGPQHTDLCIQSVSQSGRSSTNTQQHIHTHKHNCLPGCAHPTVHSRPGLLPQL